MQEYADSLKRNNSRIKLPSTKGFFYGESQLVIDKKGDFFFYQTKNSPIMCSTGSENDTFSRFTTKRYY